MLRFVIGGREVALSWLHDDGTSVVVGDEVLVNRMDTGVVRRVWYKVTKRRWEQVDNTSCLYVYLEML